MPSRTLDLGQLVEEHDTVRDVDGKEYDLVNVADLTSEDFAAVNRLQREMTATMRSMERAKNDAASEAAAKQFDELTSKVIIKLLPTMPVESVVKMPVGRRAQIAQFWNEQQQARGKQASAEGDLD